MVGTSIEFDAVLDVCQHEHRRIVLAALAGQQSVPTSDLATAVVEHSHHVPATDAAGETMAKIEITLHHVHLPKLEDAGLVEYDHERKLVTPTAAFERGVPHLSAILDADVELATPLEM